MNVLLILFILALLLAFGVSIAHIITLRKKNDELHTQCNVLQAAADESGKETAAQLHLVHLAHRNEETLRDANKDLERIIAERTEELDTLTSFIHATEELLRVANKDLENIAADHAKGVAEIQQRTEELQKEKALVAALETALAESEIQVQNIIIKTPMPACVVSTHGMFEIVNNALCDLLERTDSELLDQHFSLLIPEEKKKDVFAAWNTFLAGAEDLHAEVELRIADGTEKVAALEIITIVNARRERKIIVFAADISKQRKAEEDIRQALEHEKELRELKSSFVSMVSHELRTPLTTILSNAELLERFSAKWDDEKRNRALHRILESIQRMMDLLNDVLFIGKVDAGKMDFHPAPLDLSLLCQDINDEIFNTGIGKRHNLQFAIQGNTSDIPVDPKLLRNAISNVLSNAVKYSSVGSTVSCMIQRSDTEAIITVRDEGIGIMPEDRKKLFSVFHRGSNVGTIQGTGLGLAIVKYCIETHSGTVGIESEEGKGTAVTMKLPIGTISKQ